MKDMLIVDDCSHSFSFQLDNGVPIIEYKGNPLDEELKCLVKYLLECAEQEDIREYNKNRLKLAKLLQVQLPISD